MDGELSLGGEEVQGAVLFSDIRGFTAMSEKMSAPEVVEFLNRYFSFVAEPILERGGVINKFIGDAVMVIFSPVFGQENYQKQAVLTALDMRKALERFNKKYPEYGQVGFGVGIHAGNLVAGNIGVQDRLEYTVIGDTVNLASRLEGQTKELTRDIIVSETVAKALDEGFASEVALEEVTTVTVKGKDELITVYSFA
jgi:adenylate cyclase